MNVLTQPVVLDGAHGTARPPLRRAGAACALGATVLAVGGFLTQLAATTTDVPKTAWSYPWSSRASVAISVLWGCAQVLLVVGLLALRRSEAAGTGRGARWGLPLALVGTAMIVAGHAGSTLVADQTIEDTAPQVLGALTFGLGTVLSAVGLLAAGVAVLGAAVWQGWRRWTVLVAGVATLALIPLQLTPALPSAVGAYALTFVGIGAALARESRRNG